MAENDKTSIEEETFSLFCVQDGQKGGRKNSEMFQETPVEYNNSSKASGERHPLVE